MTLSEIYTALNNGDLKTVTIEIKRLNKLYRDGDPEITDPEYDRLIETVKFVDPENELFTSGVIETVEEINPERKDRLKYPMFSLEKLPTIDDVKKWLINKGLPLSTVLICTAKYDGISILKDEQNSLAWSRGDGIFGETMHEHYKMLNDKSQKMNMFTIGELLFPKQIFASRTFYRENGEPYKNARNMMGGLKNSDTVSEDLKYSKHIRYGFADENFSLNKSEQLDFISNNLAPVPYRTFIADELDLDELNDLYTEWSVEYDIDGLVLDIDDKDIRKSLGREKNNNPAYARAFKNPDWATKNETSVKTSEKYKTGIEWNIGKTRALSPVVLLEPFDVDGVTVSRATGYNAKFIRDNQIGKGAVLEVIRSGAVIPKIVGVVKVGELELPTHCPSCGTVLEWSETGVDLCCNNEECPEVKFQKLAFFFVRFKISGFAEKTIQKFFDAGYDTVSKILSMSLSEIKNIEGMANLSATKLLKEFDEKVKRAPFNVIGHASGCFENIGSKKLKMIVDGVKELYNNTEVHERTTSLSVFKSSLENMDMEMLANMLQYPSEIIELTNELIQIKGVSDKTAKSFLNGLIDFSKFMNNLNIEISDEPIIKETQKNINTNYKNVDLTGRVFVFTGVRDAELKSFIESCGGLVKDDITKATTDLITKNEDSTSSKAKKAKAQGANVIQIDVFKESLK
jgi:NAD-dependent DNA ligase